MKKITEINEYNKTHRTIILVENAYLITHSFSGMAWANGEELPMYEFDDHKRYFIGDPEVDSLTHTIDEDDAKRIMINDIDAYLESEITNVYEVPVADVSYVEVNKSKTIVPIDDMSLEDIDALIENNNFEVKWMECKFDNKKFAKRVLVWKELEKTTHRPVNKCESKTPFV